MSIEKNIREPKQKRSIQMKEEILNTALDLICKKGYYNTTTNEIAKVAGISIGSLYSYFADKDTILMELLERYNQHFLTVFETIKSENITQLYQQDKREWLYCLVKTLIQLHQVQKDFAKEINVLYYAKSEVAALIDEQSEKVRNSILDVLLQNCNDIKTEDLEASSVIIYDYITALVDRVVFKDNIINEERIIDTGIDMLYMCLMR